MNLKHRTQQAYGFVIAILLCTTLSSAHAADDTSGFYQTFTANQESHTVNEAVNRAADERKPLLLILGADWCHDSRALAGYFDTPEVKKAAQSFEVLSVDVGYLEDKSDWLQQFAYPAYFATPTVLAIDPVSKTVLNRESLVKWQSAHNESALILADYLSSMNTDSEVHAAKTETPVPLAQFELQQANVLYAHYNQLGALLKLEDEGQDVPELNEKWREVKAFRVQLQKDLIRLHSSNGISEPLPTYPAISWSK